MNSAKVNNSPLSFKALQFTLVEEMKSSELSFSEIFHSAFSGDWVVLIEIGAVPQWAYNDLVDAAVGEIATL